MPWLSFDVLKAKELKDGMDIFGVMTPAYQELEEKERELEKLRMIWETRQEWDELYSSWKDGRFRDLQAPFSPSSLLCLLNFLQVESMEEKANLMSKSLIKQGREIGNRTIWRTTKTIIDGFKQTMPLISDLRNPALRQRHWDALIEEIGQPVEPNSDDFTLDSMIKLKLDLFGDFISELSSNASKELAIEQSIEVSLVLYTIVKTGVCSEANW